MVLVLRQNHIMSDSASTTSRVLSLLNLLQTHRHWPGPELASRLAVTARTLRRDVERLRELGYRVESVPGAGGGYRLEAGAALPPLLLTDDEAVTMAIGLRLAATQGLEDGEHTTLTALAKLEQVLPSALRRRVNALAATVQSTQVPGSAVSPEVLGVLALACRDRERIRFRYVAGDGAETVRTVEPHSLVSGGRNWFLAAWDRDREDWRTFRVDRLSAVQGTRVIGEERILPADAGEFVRVAMNSIPTRLQAAVVMDLPLQDMQERFGPWSKYATAETATTTRWPIGGDSFQEMMFALVWVPEGVAYRIEGNEEFADFMREVGSRMATA
jgi:predicted DNA-binding transcriptional regulator YafY